MSGPEQIDRESWNGQYRSGRWEYLAGDAEEVRYRALTEFVHSHGPAPSVLDIGCGSCLLYQAIGGADFAGSYLGTDWSEAALPHGPWTRHHRVLCADVRNLPLVGKFDVIVCSEVLYYLDDPELVVDGLLGFLADKGSLLVSLFQPRPDRQPDWCHYIGTIDTALTRHPSSVRRSTIVDPSGRRTWSLHVLRGDF